MSGKSRSWPGLAVFFVLMCASYLGFSALSAPLRHQMGSIHSMFWTFDAPWSLACCALFTLALGVFPAMAARLRKNRSTRGS